MEKKKIWIVSELFYPEETATAYIFTRIANFLSKDYDVSVISGPEFYDSNKIGFKDCYQLSDRIIILRTQILKLDKDSLIQRLLRAVFLTLQMSYMVIRNVAKGDVVLLATNPAPLLLMMGVIKKIKKFQLHILVHDVFPENTIPAHIFKNDKSILYRLLKLIFDRAYSQADHLIAIGRDMKEVLVKKTKRFKHRPSISIVPNWSKPIELKPNSKEKITELKNNDQRKIILQYAGNIGRVQGLDVLIDSFVSSNNPDIQLVLRGTGALYSSIEKSIIVNNWKNVDLFGGYSRNEENEILSNCDVAIVPLAKGMYGLGVPSKTYNILSAGKPILFIGEQNSEISLMVKEYNIGWSIDVNNTQNLVNFFENIKPENLSNFVLKGQRAHWLSENKYDEKDVLKLFQKQMESNFKK